MNQSKDSERVAEFRAALDGFVERVAEDRYLLAIVLVGSLTEETVWNRERLWLWIIESDGVSKRLRSDGDEERIFRILVENEINLHAEVIPRSRFKRMVEGSSRTAFSCNFFAHRELVHCNDPSIESWFDQANEFAVKDQDRELLAFTTWTIHAHEHASKRFHVKRDIELAAQEIIGAAHSVAYTEIIRDGQIWEQDVIYRAVDLNPDLFQTIYLDVLAKRRNRAVLSSALDAIEGYLDQHWQQHLKPLMDFFKKQPRVVPLSEISDHFAYSQLYPWHLVSACEWLQRKGRLEKLSAPFKLTKRSTEEVEEPAYFLDD
ncbi:MAG: hypothetical protein AAGG48_13285 [Planctomycetota bacterium]